jgi:hypothetical protein
MKNYEAKVYIGKDLYTKLDYIAKTTGQFTGVNQLLGALVKDTNFTSMVDTLLAIAKGIEKREKGEVK